ncbi:putative uncharacterized protein DDB_G0292292 [Cotesia glomerata]|uniref:putative uncharacterized protein DDB_G0292292 n=1 Tax=Cotesia glomerata TaxID=32391 RepID=UPI001D016ADC|nr:putative uncharacterized protein DDB_G0292292 [Cotesia glomerata]XP_044575697.1 putative uncharacterized protein DDB_G0292292 [Cotesia glomerata]XP_044575698.1 putative uncharacterized protein DDB_G0292292 [Cotesia glomerata]
MLSSRKQHNNNFNKLIILLFISILSTNVISAPSSELKNSPPLPPPAGPPSSKRISILEDPQHPSALAWSVLLLADSSVLDSPSPPRRITPKSIFIAPPLQTCPEGYQPDSMNRCVKDVNINQEAYFDFLLQRLNAMYGNLGNPQHSNPPSSSSSSPSSNGSLGPFQLNIPIVINSDKESPNPDSVSEKPSVSVSDDKRPENETKKQETIITVYEIEESNNNNNNNNNKNDDNNNNNNNNNETKPNDDKSLENEQLIPVVEIIETNPNGSEIVDYTIPIKLYNVTNNTDTKNNTVTSNKENSLNESSVSTLVVLLSPTKLQPNITEDSNKIKNQSIDKDIANVRNSSTNEEINISLPESTVTTTLSPIKIFLNSSSSSTPLSSSSVSINTNTDYEDAAQVTEKNGDVIYDDTYNNKETIDYNTDEGLEDHTEDFEESTESDYEILKHSEAGMAVTTSSRFYTTSSSIAPDVQNDKDKDDSDKISSEVHINRDFIRETTLVGLNYDKNNGSTEIDKEIQSTTPLDDEDTEDNTEITENTEKVTEFQTQMPVSLVDKIFDPFENINPVITIEEASLTGFIDRKTTTTETKVFKSTTATSTTPFIVYPSQTETPISQTVNPLPQADVAEIMAVSSSNEAETVLPEQESQNPIIVKPIDNKTSQEASSSHNPVTDPKKEETFSQNKQVFDYNPAPHISSFSSHKLEDNPVIKTIDNQKIDLNKNPVNFFPNNNYQPPYNPPRDYVRFPMHDQQPSRPNYVRFPSEEANSIHTDDSKERYHNRYPPLQNNRLATAKLGTFKRPVWPIPPTWRLDRQHSRVKSTDDEDQKQNENTPMLMRFWKRMPLILDPSLINNSPNLSFSQIPTQFEPNERTGRSYSSYRGSYYQEMSPQDVTQSFIRIQR